MPQLWQNLRVKRRQQSITTKKKRQQQRKLPKQSRTLKSKLKPGSSGKLFGAATFKEVATVLNEQLGISIDKKKLTVADIKNFGEYTATVKLFKDIAATFTVAVTPEE